jgi:MFS family permease
VLKAGTAAIGLIDGLAETTASLMKIYSGALSDRLGTRKWITVVGYALSACAKPFLYFANTWSLVLAVRVSDRLGKGIRTAPRDALVADSIDEERRGLAFGLHRAGDTAGAFIGVLTAAVIVWMTEHSASELSRRTFQTAVLISILPALLAVLILAFGAKDTGIRSKSKTPMLSMKGMEKRFKLFMLVLGLFALGNSSDAFIILLGQNRGLSVLQIMLMLMTFNFVYSVLAGPLGALSDATEGSAKAFVADLVAPDQRGKAYGICNAVIGLAAFPASVIAGLLWQGAFGWSGFGPSAPFLLGAGLAVLAGILFWKIVPAQHQSPIPR